MTVADQIDAAIAAALATVPNDPEIEIEPAGDPTRFPALGVYAGDWRAIEYETDLIRWQMALFIEGFVQGGGGSAPTAERNALHAATVAAIMQDQALAALVEIIEPGDLQRSTATMADQRRLSFGQDFTVQFTTSRTNPALPA
jgi:hypothetical protein